MIRLVVVGVVNTEAIAKLIFMRSAKLANIAISLTNELFERLAKARGIVLAGNTTLPTGIIFACQRLSNFQKPLFILGVFFATFARCFFHFLRPCRRYFACNSRSLPSAHLRFGLALEFFAHMLSAFGRSFISRAICQCHSRTIGATFNAASNCRSAVNAQVWFTVVDDFSHLSSTV